jgi:DNA-directed RNA polymerase specialized sigma24 family protein
MSQADEADAEAWRELMLKFVGLIGIAADERSPAILRLLLEDAACRFELARHVVFAQHQIPAHLRCDLASELLLCVHRRLESYMTPEMVPWVGADPFREWFSQLVGRACSSTLRSLKRDYFSLKGGEWVPLALAASTDLQELQMDVLNAIETLPAPERQVVLAFMDWQSIKTVARELRISYKKARGALERAQTKLRLHLLAYSHGDAPSRRSPTAGGRQDPGDVEIPPP